MNIKITPNQESIESSLGISQLRAIILHKILDQTLDDKSFKSSSDCIKNLSTTTDSDNETAYLLVMFGKIYGINEVLNKLNEDSKITVEYKSSS